MNASKADAKKAKGPVKKLAFQGAPGCFGHLAGHLFCKLKMPELDRIRKEKTSDIKYTPCQSYDEVVKAVVTGAVDFGILPLENSSVGTAIRSFELLSNNQVALLADLFMPTRHCLIGLPGTNKQNIRRIISHPMALKQCRLYLSKQDNIEVRPYWDTAGACFYIKRTQDASVGAIAGEAAAQAAGLKVFERNIDDFHSNETRFGIISKIDLAMGAVKAEFPDSPRLSCSVELDRKQNDLSKFLKETLSPSQVELLNTISFPIAERPWEYIYILEIKVESNEETQAIWTKVRTNSAKARILGIYESLKPILDKAG